MTALTALPVRTCRLLGSAAIMFAWVAAGRLTAYFEADLNSWDIAAGALLVTEAGGKMSHIDGSPYTLRTRCVIGSNGKTHDALCDALQGAGVLGLDPE
jgi:myo-inositol-1(or 4)-monophosphatase